MSQFLAKDAAICGLGNIPTRSMRSLRIPLYTSHLTAIEYRILTLFNLILQIAVTLFKFAGCAWWLALVAGHQIDRQELAIASGIFITTSVVLSRFAVYLQLALPGEA